MPGNAFDLEGSAVTVEVADIEIFYLPHPMLRSHIRWQKAMMKNFYVFGWIFFVKPAANVS